MEQYFDSRLAHFALTAMFSFLIGLEIKTYRLRFHPTDQEHTFGSARTYTFLGILGYLCWLLGTAPYLVAMAGVTLLFALFYVQQLNKGRPSILFYLAALLVYTIGPLSELFAIWLPSLVFVLMIFLLNAKPRLQALSKSLNAEELETVGKMVLLSAVILPLLPHQPIGTFLPLSPFELWSAVVIVSSISYGGYLAQKYIFRQRGYLIAGLIGGLYSSTATTVVLSRKAAEIGNRRLMTGAIVAASAMMYLRLIVIAVIFTPEVAEALLLPFMLFALAAFAIAAPYALRQSGETVPVEGSVDTNPLELGTAFLFATLFVVMMAVTQLVTAHFGTGGLQLLSFAVGFTDIDPFVLSLLTGHEGLKTPVIVSSVMIAAGSNNLLKAIYAVWFGGFAAGRIAALWLLLLGLSTIGVAFFI
ncbi:DUF4010 domain-containing protein [Sulfurimonas sp. HSL1-2]|uniref:MgtC/SapB family protein n=1 Tax=Thiomicrolovo zhangzhouensis TaxID=3131933 RepID=UPI0031F9FEE5